MSWPFYKDIDDLTLEDLRQLRNIAEGWFVEYKVEVSKPAKVARSVSSFANHHGGWIFYGIAQSRSGENTAESFVGIPNTEVSRYLERIRDAIATNTSPAPFFETKVLSGPATELQLADDKSIIIVRVPEGANPPYVHSSGRIYRRIADRSDPTAETDRAVLDLLWEKGKESRRVLSERLLEIPTVSKAEEDQTYLHFHILSDPLRDREILSRMSFDRFRELMKNSTAMSGGIPFDGFQTFADGYTARGIFNNDPHMRLTTWNYYSDCSSRVTFPILAPEFHRATERYRGYKYSREFFRICDEKGIGHGNILDATILWSILYAFIRRHRVLCMDDGVGGPFFAKIFVENTWRRIPYIDTRSYIDFIQSNGVPVIQDDEFTAPPGADYETLIVLPKTDPESLTKGEETMVTSEGILLTEGLYLGLGIPGDVVYSDVRATGEAFNRAAELHRGDPPSSS